MAIKLFDKYQPAEIFRMIDNQSVSVEAGERLIKRYGDRRALEAVMEYRRTQGIDLGKEMNHRLRFEKTGEKMLGLIAGAEGKEPERENPVAINRERIREEYSQGELFMTEAGHG